MIGALGIGTPLDNILMRLNNVKSEGGGKYKALCPTHDDHNPSLSISEGYGGKVLLKCWAGCATEDVVSALDLQMKDLFPDDEPTATNTKRPSRIADTYDYKDRGGKLLFQVVRYEPKDFRQRRPDGGVGWIYDLKDVDRVLYRLPELVTSGERAVFIVEGEKDADRLADLGLVATCNPMGAGNGKWHGSYTDQLAGRHVVILPDNDAPGCKHAQTVARSLMGVAASVRILEFPELPDKGDVSDWLDQGGTLEELQRLAEEAPIFTGETGEYEGGPSVPHIAGAMPDPAKWPKPPGDEAFLGLAGRVVAAIDPHTESDRVAVLCSFLAAFGCAVGRGPHAMVGATRHDARVWFALVGRSSKARKGDSFGTVRALFAQADSIWESHRIQSGLTSGEGLIHAVRDARFERVKNKKTREYEETEVDEGVVDKRLFVLEPEFARLLQVMSRQGNSLNAVIRDAWDRGDLQSMSKTQPGRVTGAHIAIVGHITAEELKRELSATDTANGFANRFIWLAVDRSKLLPEPDVFQGAVVDDLAGQIAAALVKARGVGLMRRDAEARELWEAVYPELAKAQDGLAWAVLARAEAYVLRLSLIYALLDGSDLVGVEHLAAALTLWNYSERSALYIWGDATGDSVADMIMGVLRKQGPLTRTQISDLFQRNTSAARIQSGLDLLAAQGKAVSSQDGSGGRPTEMWQAVY